MVEKADSAFTIIPVGSNSSDFNISIVSCSSWVILQLSSKSSGSDVGVSRDDVVMNPFISLLSLKGQSILLCWIRKSLIKLTWFRKLKLDCERTRAQSLSSLIKSLIKLLVCESLASRNYKLVDISFKTQSISTIRSPKEF